MKKLPEFKKIISISFWLLFATGTLSLLGFVENSESKKICSGIRISIDSDASGNYFINEEDVLEIIDSKGFQVSGSRISEMKIHSLEKVIRNNPYVKNAEVYTGINGLLNVEITQREPLLKIISNKGESYYLDNEGELMPPNNSFSPHILVASGNIGRSYNGMKAETEDSTDTIIHELFVLADFLKKDAALNAMFEQIYVNHENEIELIPRIGKHIILLGDVSGLEEKLFKLEVFYKQYLNKHGWNKYQLINLKFKNQVVCKKVSV